MKPGLTTVERATRGLLWMFIYRGLDSVMLFARTIILARLLQPEDFGLVGMATITLALLSTISQLGFDAALIQEEDPAESYLDTVWSIQVLRGIFVFVAIGILTIPVSRIFGEPRLVPILLALSLAFAIRGFHNVGITYLRRKLIFRGLFIYLLFSTIAGFIAGLVAAFYLRNAWALVIGELVAAVVGLIVSYIVYPYWPRFEANLVKTRKLFHFSRWVWLGNILYYLLIQGDDLFVGKILGATALGLYQMAYMISNFAATQITLTLMEITFPAYSRIQNKIWLLRSAYLNTVKGTAFITFPLTGAIVFFAADFIRLFLGQQWMAIVVTVKILAVWGVIRSIGMITGSIFMATNNPDIGVKVMLYKVIVLGVLILPLTIKWNINGAALAVVLSALLINPWALRVASKLVALQFRILIKVIAIPILNTLAMLTLMTLIKSSPLVTTPLSFLSMVLLAGIGAVIYLLFVIISDRTINYGIEDLIKARLVELGF